MDNNELKEYIEDVETRLEKEFERLDKCTLKLKEQINRLEKIQIKCPVLAEVTEAKDIASKARLVGRWNIAVMGVFLLMLIFVLKLQLFNTDEIKPKDVKEIVEHDVLQSLDDIKNYLRNK